MSTMLAICAQGYRATIEEQDDTVVWLIHLLQRNGIGTAILLRGSAVNYANAAQQPVAVSFGAWTQSHPADLARDLTRYQAEGGRVLAVREDLAAYGITDAELIDGVTVVARDEIATVVSEYDSVSIW